MTISANLLLLACTALGRSASAVAIGDRVSRVYTEYFDQPLDSLQALASGYTADEKNPCDSSLGFSYSKAWDSGLLRGTSTSSNPTQLYYSASGQITGFSVDIYGNVETTPLELGYFDKVADDHYRISIGLRSDTSSVCDPNATFADAVGDTVVVQPNSIAIPLPLSEADAINQNYHKGSCFDGMGFHYFLDLKTPDSSMSWEADALSPVVVMYNLDGEINAIFIASSDVQEGIMNAHEWEPVPLPEFAFCGNFCDQRDTCKFSGNFNGMWSTMHWYFKNYEEVKCTDWGEMSCYAGYGDLMPTPGLACCPNQSAF